jgi:hypothetical protein
MGIVERCSGEDWCQPVRHRYDGDAIGTCSLVWVYSVWRSYWEWWLLVVTVEHVLYWRRRSLLMGLFGRLRDLRMMCIMGV